MRHIAICAALVLFLQAGVAQARTPARPAPANEKWVEHQLAKGETIYGLAARYLHRQNDYVIVQRVNAITRDRALPPGTRVRIPVRLLRSEPLNARLAAFRGSVAITLNGDALAATPGANIAPGSVLSTGAGGFMTIELSNGSRITLPSHSRLRIVAMRRFLLGNRLDFDFLLEQGRIETGVTPMPSGAGQYRIRTPIAVSAVRGTTFRVGYDGLAAPSLTEVLDGTVAVAPKGASATAIPRGFGAGVSASGQLKQEELLLPPLPIRPGRVQVDPVVMLAVDTVAGARAYRFQIGRDAGFMDIEAEVRTDTPTASFADIANGAWFVRATAIADSGLEGMPQIYTMRRTLTALNATADGDAQSGWTFKWGGTGEGARVYHFRLRPDRDGAMPLIDEPGLRGQSITVSSIPPGQYKWQVGVRQYDKSGSSENWLPETPLLVAAPE